MSKLTNRLGKVVAPGVVEFENREMGELPAGKVRIRIVASAICGSDLHIFKGKHPAVSLPVTIGHELSGEIVELGADVQGFSKGDRVTIEPVVACGHCLPCRQGNYGYCENISYTYRVGDGAMANYIDAWADRVYRLPEGLSWDAGALIEPLSVATHAVKRADIAMGEKVVIFGAGAIGLLVAAICRRRGAGEVVIVDFADARLKLASELGATLTLNPQRDDVNAALQRVSGGSGMDKAFECVGIESTFVQSMMCLKRNGLTTIVGIFENPNIVIPASRFASHEIRVQGSQGYCWDFPVALQLCKDIDLEKLVSHRFALDDLQKALETCLDRGAGSIKVIVRPEAAK